MTAIHPPPPPSSASPAPPCCPRRRRFSEPFRPPALSCSAATSRTRRNWPASSTRSEPCFLPGATSWSIRRAVGSPAFGHPIGARIRPPQRLDAYLKPTPRAALRAAWLTGALIGLDCRAAGFTIAATPVLDICRSQAPTTSSAIAPWPRTRPPLPGWAGRWRMACWRPAILPVGKHAPGHGRARVDSHLLLPKVAEQDLSADMRPFALNADLPWMMTAHIVYEAFDPALPATLSPAVIGNDHPRADRLRRSSGDRRPGDEGTFGRARPAWRCRRWRLAATSPCIAAATSRRPRPCCATCPPLTRRGRPPPERGPGSRGEPASDAGPGRSADERDRLLA